MLGWKVHKKFIWFRIANKPIFESDVMRNKCFYTKLKFTFTHLFRRMKSQVPIQVIFLYDLSLLNSFMGYKLAAKSSKLIKQSSFYEFIAKATNCYFMHSFCYLTAQNNKQRQGISTGKFPRCGRKEKIWNFIN